MAEAQHRVAIVGAGYIADWHLKALKTIPNLKVVAVCDSNASRAESFAKSYGISTYVKSIDELVAAGICNVAHILLPADLHHSEASKLLENQIDVLLEKPATTSVADCRHLAEVVHRTGRHLGVSHNFLFDPNYVFLRNSLHNKELGKIRDARLCWHRELPFAKNGPFHTYAVRQPGNVIFEVGPHLIAALIDLFGMPNEVHSTTSGKLHLPGGGHFFQKWNVHAKCANGEEVSLTWDFGSSYGQHCIEVRGRNGLVIADLESGTAVMDRYGAGMLDWERMKRTVRHGKTLIWQGKRNWRSYLLSKLKLKKHGNLFGASIFHSLSEFYRGRESGTLDPRFTIDFATLVIDCCEKIVQQAIGAVEVRLPEPAPLKQTATGKPTVLVLGGTGFIGQSLVQQLVREGHSVRLLARDPDRIPLKISALPLDLVRGDLTRPETIHTALEGIETVFHLARAYGNRWEDYLKGEVYPTLELASLCDQACVKLLVYSSTIDSYYSGDLNSVLQDNTKLDPKIHRRNLYAQCKALCEKNLEQFSLSHCLKIAVARPGIVIGSGGSPFHWGVGMWYHENTCLTWGTGDHPLPFVLATDVATALTALLRQNSEVSQFQTFNLVGDPVLTGREYLKFLSEFSESQITTKPTSAWYHFRNDLLKWLVKIVVRHPNRRRPSYRDWKSRYHISRYESNFAKEILQWQPANREKLIKEGIELAVTTWIE
ncbi:MAG: Gfo/Idh/MocA family oxidoreductase [Zavarzinella sp.]